MSNPHPYQGDPGGPDGGPGGGQDGLRGTQGGRKGLRNDGLNGIHIGGPVAGPLKITGLELLPVTGVIVFSVNGLKRPPRLNTALLSVLSGAARAAVQSTTITVKADTPNSILDLRLNLLFLFLNREFFILPPCLWLISLSQLSTNNFKINEIYYFSICLVSNPSVTFLVTALFIRWKHRGWFSEWNGLKQLAAIRII